MEAVQSGAGVIGSREKAIVKEQEPSLTEVPVSSKRFWLCENGSPSAPRKSGFGSDTERASVSSGSMHCAPERGIPNPSIFINLLLVLYICTSFRTLKP